MKSTILALLFTVIGCTWGYTQENTKEPLSSELQIKIAVLAAPPEFRDGVKVYGYNENHEFVVLREGTNGYICLAPNYKEAGLYAYCYPVSLEPFMARGRELIAEGKRKERDKIREEEFKAGKLSIPQTPSILYGYYGSYNQLDKETGEIADAKRRYVIYMPYAKAADIGLSNKPNNLGMPWLMDEGSYKAHIMITPPHTHGKN